MRPFGAETPLPLYRYRRWVRVDGGRGVPWVLTFVLLAVDVAAVLFDDARILKQCNVGGNDIFGASNRSRCQKTFVAWGAPGARVLVR